ncbi:MAG: hypothetical protein A3G33_06420 [Omnitrophica bacterium RIFCSPLOWO2_12_FULL_44_17]|uniref:Uncharacterized protein n=1 Tax=Candidatus Danuiimicrobium aquiferis TaxID=1801832 RepID=A0A1G1L1J0_9BACT|nr:MAG: hypothetical protein A3G33_06420 [Omnitrophica bacterium RIFCSPLOWO2_12_FULL_44_17]OGX04190.1 MAG: hypothetical protein A3J12_03355 [Omnitrophica bacterium RIFCSPLOWO2_02_FULL_44_11]
METEPGTAVPGTGSRGNMLWALIMVGGGGTRLWPLSSREVPKPFLKVIPGKESFFKETVKRLSAFVDSDRMMVVGNELHLPMLRREAPRIPRNNIIGEPVGRNTAPTVALAASLIHRIDPKAHLLVLPADAWIETRQQFKDTIHKAYRVAAEKNSFCIFGVKPSFPSTSYGYIRYGEKISDGVYHLKKFIEKPDETKAKRFLKEGNYLWHAGIFLASTKLVLDSLKRFAPEVLNGINRLNVENGKIQEKEKFAKLPNISIDFAVLEKIKKAYLIQAAFQWCDVGTWNSFEGLWPKDGNKNSVFGNCLSLKACGNVVYSKEKPVYLFGVEDLVVVNTPDSILVTKKGKTEEMRALVAVVQKSNKRSTYGT